jgi:hypothetical protein
MISCVGARRFPRISRQRGRIIKIIERLTERERIGNIYAGVWRLPFFERILRIADLTQLLLGRTRTDRESLSVAVNGCGTLELQGAFWHEPRRFTTIAVHNSICQERFSAESGPRITMHVLTEYCRPIISAHLPTKPRRVQI